MDIVHIIDIIGETGPYIITIMSVILLIFKTAYLKIFLLGGLLNVALNVILKLYLKNPRPSDDKKALEIGISNGRIFSFDKYGMPSGHAQMMLYAAIYILLVYNSPILTITYFVITINTLFRMLNYNNTLFQLGVGAGVGTIVGYISYSISKYWITGDISPKPDEKAPK